MKIRGKFALSLAAAICLMSQTALGANLADGNLPGTNQIKQEWVNMDLGPGEAVWAETTEEPGFPESSAPSEEGNQTTESEEIMAPPSTDNEEENLPSEEQLSPSPVIEIGQGNQMPEETKPTEETAAPAQEADAQAKEADEAARLAAEEAARQAEEAARQAEETARQAEEAARQAEEAARQAAGRVIDPSRPMVALTFDDGPQPSVGNRIMDCLAQYGGKATFFLVGERVAPYASEVRRMVEEGHEVANHSMNHKYLQKLGAAQIQAQVNSCNDAIEAACGVRPKIMRLPGGNHNATVRANTHMPMIQWNIDTLDWKTKNAQKTIQSVLGSVKDGDIVLMHELYSQTGDAATQIIPELVNRGYQLVTVSEMAEAKGYPLEAGNLYSSFR